MSEPDKSPGLWGKLDVISKFITGFVLVVIAFLVDYSSKRIAQSNEENKIVQSLIEDLTSKQEESRNDVALLSLEKYLVSRSTEKDLHENEAYIGDVAETILKQRVHDDSSFSLESSIPYRIWNKYDSASANTFFAEYVQDKKDTSVINNNNPVSALNLATIKPVMESKNATEASVISSFKKKICYIQYSSHENTSLVSSFQDTLRSINWVAPGIDFVEGNYGNTIKYFNPDDRKLAQNLKNLASQHFHSDFQVVAVLSTKYKVPKGQVEIWINN